MSEKEKFGTEFSRAVKEWQASKEYTHLTAPLSAFGGQDSDEIFIKSRLFNAFAAGWNARADESESLRDENEWIEIKSDDDLPPEETRYLFTVETAKGRKVALMNRRQIWANVRIVAYRPLPEPFGMKEEN